MEIETLKYKIWIVVRITQVNLLQFWKGQLYFLSSVCVLNLNCFE